MPENVIHILLVDDDGEYASVMKHHLREIQKNAFELTWIDDGDVALQKLSGEHDFDVVVIDYYFPHTNGLEIVRRMYEAKIQIPIVFLTAHKDFRIAVEAIKYGVEEYLVKDEAAMDTVFPRTIVNVLERVRLKRQIAEANKKKLLADRRADGIQELIVTMCHELNNPLAAIKISSDILLRQQANDDEKSLLHTLNNNISILEKQILKLRDRDVQK